MREEHRELRASKNNDTQPPVNYIEGLPLESLDELNDFELSLQDPDNKQQLVIIYLKFLITFLIWFIIIDKFCEIHWRQNS